VTLEFIETPLSDIVSFLVELQRIPIHIAARPLADAGIETAQPVTFTARDLPLRSALDLMLADLDLAWTIRSGVLVVTSKEDADETLVLKTYDVSDLLGNVSDHEYPGGSLPTVSKTDPWRGLCGAGLGGGQMGGGGMGLFDVGSGGIANGGFGAPGICLAPGTYGHAGPPTERLVELVTSAVAPSTWDQAGGPGTCTGFQAQLVVRQTYPVHRQIETLLDCLRAQSRGRPALAIEARWLLLDGEQRDRFSAADKQGAALAPEELQRLIRDVPGFHGRIVCLNGQKVFLAAGSRRTVIHGAIPVIGSGVGYQPVVEVPNVGVLLEVCPSLSPQHESVLLDVKSTVTDWGQPDRPLEIGSRFPPAEVKDAITGETTKEPGGTAWTTVDRVNLPTQQLATTLRLPLGRPVLVGGVTRLSAAEAGEKNAGPAPEQLYLVIEVNPVLATRTDGVKAGK